MSRADIEGGEHPMRYERWPQRHGRPVAALHTVGGGGGWAVRGSALSIELGERAVAFTRIDDIASREVARKGLTRVPPSIEDRSDDRRLQAAWKAFREAS
jgi:hypothetical protein